MLTGSGTPWGLLLGLCWKDEKTPSDLSSGVCVNPWGAESPLPNGKPTEGNPVRTVSSLRSVQNAVLSHPDNCNDDALTLIW